MTARDRHTDIRRPSPHQTRLVAAMTCDEDFRIWAKGSKLFFRRGAEPLCHFVRKGSLLLARNEDAFSLGILSAPLALGLIVPLSEHLHLRTMTESEIATLPYERVIALVEEKQIWDLVAKHVMYMTNKIFIYNEMLTAPTSFDILRYQLLMLIQETDDVRASTSAYQYILDRTRLSRSSIMKMLAELKKGNYIQLENGKLIAIHHLPNRF
jgi:CRP-like cAMP-binding protein